MTEIITLEMRRGFMKNYTYLVHDPVSRTAVIVDPSWQMEKIERAIADLGVTLGGVLITHAHADHIHLAVPVADKYDCPIWMSKEEAVAAGFSSRHLVHIDGCPWSVGVLSIEPILTPGHTPGCTCYLIGDDIFTGDVLFAEGCGMCRDAVAADAMFDSLEKLKARLDPWVRVYPGHSYGKRPGRRMSDLLRDNIYLQFTDRRLFAAFRLRRGQDPARMFTFA
jgi:hydroxyacylglutathione hydrolase